jgi:hypothetical protein
LDKGLELGRIHRVKLHTDRCEVTSLCQHINLATRDLKRVTIVLEGFYEGSEILVKLVNAFLELLGWSWVEYTA